MYMLYNYRKAATSRQQRLTSPADNCGASDGVVVIDSMVVVVSGCGVVGGSVAGFASS